MREINIIELAKDLNLSKSTVSRAFRNDSGINVKTKERILARAKELNFSPNHHASNLRIQKSNTIAVVVPEISNNFFSKAINGIEQVAKKNGYSVLICLTDDEFEKEVAFVNNLCHGKVDAVIMSASGEDQDHSHLDILEKKGIPLVFFDRVYEDIKAARVTTNDYESSFLATEHLLKQGCKRVAYLVINKRLSIGKTRMKGYLDALKKYNIQPDENWVIDCSNDKTKNISILKQVFKEINFDGVFASVERLAIATYYACQELNISIPEEMKVVGFSSLEIAPLLNPALSTITQPSYEMGIKAAEMLFKVLASPHSDPSSQELILSSTLVQRRSSE